MNKLVVVTKKAHARALRVGALAAVAAVASAAGAARAALPTGVESAITTAGTDLVTAGTAVVVAMIGFWAIRKVGTKLGFW